MEKVEYIEREAVEKEAVCSSSRGGARFIPLLAVKYIKSADVAPVVHGRWIMRGGKFRCSICDARASWEKEGGTGGWSHEYVQVKSRYCHSCGARMDEEESHDKR